LPDAGIYRRLPDGIMLAVRLTPKAGHDGIDGIATLSDGRPVLAVRVRAAPDKGEANAALAALMAKSLHVPKSAVTIAAGRTARLKQVRIDGDPNALAAKLAALSAV